MIIGIRDISAYMAIGAVVFILCALGIWQLVRLQEKQAIIDAFQQARTQPEIDIYEISADKAPSMEYRKVVIGSGALGGSYLHNNELYLGGRSYGRETGYEILTPVRLYNERVILVNRGFVPTDLKNPKHRLNTLRQVKITKDEPVLGMLRIPKERGMFTPDNLPEKNFWFTVDIPAMEQATGLNLEPYYIEIVNPQAKWGEFPLGGKGEPNIRNDHLGYAVTWFSLAIAAAVIFVLYRRQNQAKDNAASL
jgi:surfeit locus 1 family protein